MIGSCERPPGWNFEQNRHSGAVGRGFGDSFTSAFVFLLSGHSLMRLVIFFRRWEVDELHFNFYVLVSIDKRRMRKQALWLVVAVYFLLCAIVRPETSMLGRPVLTFIPIFYSSGTRTTFYNKMAG